MSCRLKIFIVKYYILLLFVLFSIGIGCLYVLIRFKRFPNASDPFKFMNIYGMRSNDKLKTFELIKQQTGTNKFFSFTGLDTSNQDENSALLNGDRILCSDLDQSNNEFSRIVVKLKPVNDNNGRRTVMELEMLKSLNEFKIKLEAYLKEKFGNESIIKTCSLSDSIGEHVGGSGSSLGDDDDSLAKIKSLESDCVSNDDRRRSSICSRLLSPYVNLSTPTSTVIYTKINLNEAEIVKLASNSLCLGRIDDLNDGDNNNSNTNSQYTVDSVQLSHALFRHLSCYTRVIMSRSRSTLLFSFLILALLKFIYLNTISMISVMSLLATSLVLSLALVLNSLVLDSSSFPVFNLIALAAALSINLFDSFVWSVCYTESRKKSGQASSAQPQQAAAQQQQQQQQSPADELSMKIVNSTFGQIYYYLWPKNAAFVFILFVAYLNKVELVQIVSVFSILILLSYFLVSNIAYLLIISFLSKHHHKFSFSHRIKVFEVDINKLIENIFSKLLPYLVKKFSLLWVVLFSCSTVISFMLLFYAPKVKLANDVLNFNITTSNKLMPRRANYNNSITIYIIWGSQIHETSSNGLEPLFFSTHNNDENLIDQLLDRDLETNGFENFNLIYQVCQSVKSMVLNDDQELLKQVYCFGDFLERSFVKFSSSSSSSSSSSAGQQASMKIFQNYCDPAINPVPFERFINNRKAAVGHYNNDNVKIIRNEDKSLFIDCIKWWSLNINNRSAQVLYGPLFLVNRVLPSVYLIRLETGLKASQDFEIMQDNFKRLEDWWKSLQQKHKLNERYIWWTSPDFENYFMQKKSNQQMLLGVLVPLIIILGFATYSCSNFFVSFSVFLTCVQTMAHVLAAQIWLANWHIDLLNFLLYLLTLIIVTQYTVVSGVAHRFSPHVDLKMSIDWSSTTFGGLMLAFCLISVAASAPLCFLTDAADLDLLHRLGIALLLANLIGYLAATLYFPSFMLVVSNGLFSKFSVTQSISTASTPRYDRNIRNRHYMARHFSSSSFSPSNFYSHAATGSTYIESELTNLGDYRRRTLSRCNSSFNYHNQTQGGGGGSQPCSSQQTSPQHGKLSHQSNSFEMNSSNGDLINRSHTNSNLLQIPNPNYLQIPRHSSSSLRRSSLRRQSRRFSRVRMLSVESAEQHGGVGGGVDSFMNHNLNPTLLTAGGVSLNVNPMHDNLSEISETDSTK